MTDGDYFAQGEEACAPDDVSADAHENRAGLPALAYRRGTWRSILQRLKTRLPSPLQGSATAQGSRDLNTSAADDPAVALLDAFSVVGDVLTFYQERIANEGFLRTATERRSVGFLAQSIGYRLRPGVSAAADLVFTVDESDKAPRVADVPAGAQVMHVPGPGEIPQTFETSEPLETRAEWNKLSVPNQRAPVFIDATDASAVEAACSLDLVGVSTGLRPHARLLILYGVFGKNGTPPAFRLHRLNAVTPDSKRGITRVSWDKSQSLGRLPAKEPLVPPRVYAFRTTTALFGWNAPDWHSLPEAIQKTYLLPDEPDSAEWPFFDAVPSLAGLDANGRFVTNQAPVIDLAQEHPEIVPGSFVLIADVSGARSDAGEPLAQLYRVDDAARAFRQNFRLTGHVTRLSPSYATDLDRFGLRLSVVYAASEALECATVDDPSPVGADDIELTGKVALPKSRRVLVSGVAAGADPSGPKTLEAARVESCTYDEKSHRTRVTFAPDDALSQTFERAGTVVYANVVAATHGKTVAEILGSGDGSIPFPAFTLKQQPLTHVSDASSASGASSTLSVRVNGEAWTQVSSLLDQSERAQVYTASIDDGGTTRLVFGDGQTGSRLPSGSENVSASYRIGIGKLGEVAAESIALMAKKPLGMKSVLNLKAAQGAEDPETRDTARVQAPASVLVLERVVSLSDYADFARGFAGVGKAAASVLWDGDRQVVHVTVTDTSGRAFDAEADVFMNLRKALLQWGDSEVPLDVATLDAPAPNAAPGPRYFGLKARLLLAASAVRKDVEASVVALLQLRFGAAARDLGQHVSAAEVIRVLHELSEIVAVDLDELYLRAPADPNARRVNALHSCLPAFPARVEGGKLLPAELLLIDPDPSAIVLEEMRP